MQILNNPQHKAGIGKVVEVFHNPCLGDKPNLLLYFGGVAIAVARGELPILVWGGLPNYLTKIQNHK